jgi:mannosyltransferase
VDVTLGFHAATHDGDCIIVPGSPGSKGRAGGAVMTSRTVGALAVATRALPSHPSALRRERLEIAVVLLLAAALRFTALGMQSLWEDESVTRWMVHLPFGRMLATLPHTESTPPLYYLLAWPWTRAFGFSETGLRSLSALAGVLAVAACVAAGREVAGHRAGIAAGVLAAVNPAFVWYSQDARAYSFLILLSATSIWLFLRVLRRGAREWDLWAWTLVAAAALATHYFAWFVVAPQALWLALAARTRRRVWLAVGALAVVAGALAPLALAQHSNGGTSWIGDDPLSDRLKDVPPEFMLGEARPDPSHLLLIGLEAAALVPLALALARRGTRRPVLGMVAIGLAAIAVPSLLDVAGLHIVIERNLLGAAVPLLLACAAGIALARPRAVAGLGLAALVAGAAAIFAGPFSNVELRREDWRDAAKALGAASNPRAIVVAPDLQNPSPTPPLVTLRAVYLPTVHAMPARGATVREIDVLDVRGEPSDEASDPTAHSPGYGCRYAGHRGNGNYNLFRWRCPQPVHVTPDALNGRQVLERDTSVGLQRPSAQPR